MFSTFYPHFSDCENTERGKLMLGNEWD